MPRLSDKRCGEQTGFQFWCFFEPAGEGNRDAFSAGFPSSPGVPDRRQLDQEILVTRYRHCRAAVPFGNCRQTFTALRYRCVD